MIILGLWPIAGITTVGVTPEDARQTIQTAIDCGITAFDTAFSYGYDGESDRYLGEAIAGQRDRYTVIGKVGQRWTTDRKRVVDGSPGQLTADAELSLRRMNADRFDVLFLHSPDPNVPIETSAQAIADLRRRGLCDRVGISNADVAQVQAFASVDGCDAVECPLNLLQTDMLADFIPAAQTLRSEVYCFWTLMKGLLAGAIKRDHVFADGDSRPGYDVFQGEQLERAHCLVDGLREVGDRHGMTVSQLAVGWVLSQPGVTGTLVGARRPEQIRELAAARKLNSEVAEDVLRLKESFDRGKSIEISDT
ncbi:General stress protein 69 [Rubripirellula amarantea]|uniref:General stress protein 69 n=1 Tax=Rubripirellula amarantea TaxID=2527999 RepID=A0A5C5WYC9_9BACT|nr:aldo/keto reductase [Rubripirellula amarantea]TWT55091.1 General stress protein 69 [Rubripirellula amarantea]